MKIRNILLLALGAFLLFLGARALVQTADAADRLADAVYVQDGIVRPENEGRLVVVSGTVTMVAPAYDGVYGLTLDTPAAQRYDERYVWNENAQQWEWMTESSQTIVGRAAIGQYGIASSITAQFPRNDSYDAFDAGETAGYDLHSDIGGETYLSADNREQFYYHCCDLARDGEMTLVGVQRGSTLTLSNKVGSACVNPGILTPREVSGRETRIGVVSTLLFGFLGGLTCVFFALKGVLFLKKKTDVPE
ncbi:MAG: hypothetical protein VB092_06510 [Oscillospiraceae bacterium]|nr:hypothetical protein [Oscillospiraceae bacterium]